MRYDGQCFIGNAIANYPVKKYLPEIPIIWAIFWQRRKATRKNLPAWAAANMNLIIVDVHYEPLRHDLPVTANKFRNFVRGKTRIAFAWGFALVLGFLSKDFPSTFGLSIIFLGASLRFLASGYLRKDAHLSVGGPYGFVRNPLYLGTYLMAAGALISIHQWVLFIVFTIFYVGTYHLIILDEELKLEAFFGRAFDIYRDAVPRLFPWKIFSSLLNFSAHKKTLRTINAMENYYRFDWTVARRNKAWEAYVTFFALWGFMALAAFLRNHYFF